MYAEYSRATTTLNLVSTSKTLEEEIFPAVVVCNEKHLRTSFTHRMMEDPLLRNYSFVDLEDAAVRLVKGQTSSYPALRAIETGILGSRVLSDIVDEFIDSQNTAGSAMNSGVNVSKSHAVLDYFHVQSLDRGSLTWALFPELVAQYRDDDLLLDAVLAVCSLFDFYI